MMMKTRRTMQARVLQTDRLICIDPDCMIHVVVINEVGSTLYKEDEKKSLA